VLKWTAKAFHLASFANLLESKGKSEDFPAGAAIPRLSKMFVNDHCKILSEADAPSNEIEGTHRKQWQIGP
jgi:hypothetical protein